MFDSVPGDSHKTYDTKSSGSYAMEASKHPSKLNQNISKRYRAIQDLITGCPVSAVAARHGVTKRQVRRWRFEHNRVKVRMDKAVQLAMQAAVALKLADNPSLSTLSTAAAHIPIGNRKRFTEKRITHPKNPSIVSSSDSTDVSRKLEAQPKRKKLSQRLKKKVYVVE